MSSLIWLKDPEVLTIITSSLDGTHTHTQTYTDTRKHTHHTQTHTHTHKHIHTLIHTRKHTHHAQTHTHTPCTNTRTHTHTRTRTHKLHAQMQYLKIFDILNQVTYFNDALILVIIGSNP